MSVQLRREMTCDLVHPMKLKRGQLAEIVRFPDFYCREGTVCQRFKDGLLYVGEDSCWGSVRDIHHGALVRVLPPGSVITVKQN